MKHILLSADIKEQIDEELHDLLLDAFLAEAHKQGYDTHNILLKEWKISAEIEELT